MSGRRSSTYFNPPSPCGEGLAFGPHCSQAALEFQSTLPVWGGTRREQDEPRRDKISIHPPRVGRDSKSSQKFFVNFCARKQYYQNF